MADIAKAYVQVIPSAEGISNNLRQQFGDSGQQSGNSFSSAFKKVLGKVALGGAVTAFAKGMVNVFKSAVSSYSEYEQLVGGTELMLGTAGQSLSEYAASMGQKCSEAAGAYRAMEATQNRVFTRANEAYKTAGLSANDYLTQVNGLAVGLKTALGGDASAAADLADRVVTAEADVVAAMGVSTESVQNAFNGLMKSNYTMLDNLALGITPTKQGFQELIDKVNAYNKAQGNATNYTIDNLADCQSALVDYIEMQGISGYAAAEASSTIEGSLNSVKASWENVLTALGGGGNLDSAISGLISSASTLAANLMPVIGTVVSGLVSAIPQLAQGVGDLIPQISKTIVSAMPQLATAIAGIVVSLAGAFTEMVPAITAAIPEIASALIAAVPDLLMAGVTLFMALVQALPTVIPALVAQIPTLISGIVSALTTALPLIISGGIAMLMGLVQAIPQILPPLIAAIPTLVNQLVTALTANLPLILNGALALFMGIVQALPQIIPIVVSEIPNLILEVTTTLVGALGDIIAAAAECFGGIVTGLGEAIAPVVGKIRTTITNGITAVRSFFSRMSSAGKYLIQGLISGIVAKLKDALESIRNLGKQIVLTAERALKIASPSKVFYEIGGYVAEGMANGITSGVGLVTGATEDMVGGTMAGLGAISSLDGAMNSGVRGMSQINIYAQQLSQADIDYIVTMANKRLGAALA